MSTTTQPPKPKRRWYQFSLLTLLVVVTVTTAGYAVVFGWIASQKRALRREQQALERLEELGAQQGAVSEVDDSDEWHVVGMLIGEEWTGTNADFVLLKDLTELEFVILSHPSIGTEAFEHLASCPHLDEIIVYETADTEHHIDVLRKRLPEVEVEDETSERK